MVGNVKVKTTGKLGVGCSEGYNDTWLSHQFNFQAILNNLNKKDDAKDEDTPTKTVQQVSSNKCGIIQNYSKLTKSKDLSSIKGDDMVAIFGHSMKEKNCEMMNLGFSKKKKKKKMKRKLSADENHVEKDKDDKFLLSNQTTVDYFNSKNFEQKLAALLNGTVWISKKIDESQQAEVDEDEDEKIENREVDSPELKKKKKKKKKKKEEESIEEKSNKSELEVDGSCQEEELDEDEVMENEKAENPKKKKRKKKLEDGKMVSKRRDIFNYMIY